MTALGQAVQRHSIRASVGRPHRALLIGRLDSGRARLCLSLTLNPSNLRFHTLWLSGARGSQGRIRRWKPSI